MSNQEKLNEISRLLVEKSSVSSWETIMDIIIGSEDKDQEYLVNAVLEIPDLKKWDPRYKKCPDGWWEEILGSNQLPIWWPLIQHLDYTTFEGDIGPLAFMKTILSLKIVEDQVFMLESLAFLDQLEYLQYSESEINFDCEEIGALTNLKALQLSVIGLPSIEFLTKMHNLETLDLSGCEKISDLSPIKSLKKLKKIVLQHCSSISNLTPLENLPDLVFLNIQGIAQKANLSQLESIPKLKIVR